MTWPTHNGAGRADWNYAEAIRFANKRWRRYQLYLDHFGSTHTETLRAEAQYLAQVAERDRYEAVWIEAEAAGIYDDVAGFQPLEAALGGTS